MRDKLSAVVAIFLDEIDGGQGEYARCYRMAIRGWKELELDITGVPITVFLPVASDNTADLPDNFIKETNVGVLNGKGEIASLTRNNNLISNLDGCATVQYDTDIINFDNDDKFDNYIYQHNSYGVGSYNSIGEFKVDMSANLIILNPDFNYGEIVLEYLGREEFEGEYTIDTRLVDALAAYIRWRYNIGKKGVSPQGADILMREYIREKNNAKFRIKRPTIADMNQSARVHTKIGLKS